MNSTVKFCKYFAIGVVLGLPAAITFTDIVGSVAPVTGYSMSPTLNPASSPTHDIVWISKGSLQHRHSQPGDVVALWSPNNPGGTMVKRVIGIGGEIIRTRSYRTRRVLVPLGHCWVEGDNSKTSTDSNLFGPISEGLIFGRVTHVVWPPSRWQRLKTELLPAQMMRKDV